MNPKVRSLFPMTRRTKVLGSVYFSLVLLFLAIMVSPTSYVHPLWILTFYFNGFGVLRAVTEDFEKFKNPDLMMRIAFGPLQVFTGILIVVGGIILGADSLWAGVSAVFWCFGIKNITEAVHILQSQAFEREQLRIAEARHAECAAQEDQVRKEWLSRIEEEKRSEEALLADLTAFLADADQAGNGRLDE